MISAGTGEVGDTMATHTGSLQLNAATVQSNTIEEAIAAAVSGSITVSLGGQSKTSSFGLGAGSAFRTVSVGDTTTVEFEDLVGFPGATPDYDYNDRSWIFEVMAATPTGQTVIFEETYTLTDFSKTPIQTASVLVTVTVNDPAFPDRLVWNYHLTNNNVLFPNSDNTGYFGIESFALALGEGVDVSDHWNSIGWDVYVGPEAIYNEPNGIFWTTPGEFGALIFPGEPNAVDFRFTTDLRQITVGNAQFWSVNFANNGGGGAAVPGEKPEIVITDKESVEATELKVAKWHGAFEPTANGMAVQIMGPTEGTNFDFIDRDDDRFNVWVKDPAKWNAKVNNQPVHPHIRVKISTSNVNEFVVYNDDPTEVDLVRYDGNIAGKGAGWYWSDSQMLVSNEVDDKHKSATYLQDDELKPGADGLLKNGLKWRISDRTHRIALGGTLKAEYDIGAGVKIKDEETVDVKKNVKVHGIILNKAANTPSIAKADAESKLFKANEQYAQVGIRLVSAVDNPKDPPAGVNLTNGLDEYQGVPGGTIAMTQEEKDLLGDATLRTAATDDVEVYFVNKLSPAPGSYGEAFWASGVPDAKYADSVVISSDKFRWSDLPHEIGHVLLDSGDHVTGPLARTRLMFEGGTLVDDVLHEKRLVDTEQTKLFSARPNLLTGP